MAQDLAASGVELPVLRTLSALCLLRFFYIQPRLFKPVQLSSILGRSDEPFFQEPFPHGNVPNTVSDPCCGLVGSTTTKAKALQLAEQHRDRSDCGGVVVVYDRMAHRSRPQEWLPNGYILNWRPTNCI